MVGAVIITHGRLAGALLEAAAAIAGPIENAVTVPCEKTDSTESLRAHLKEAVRKADAGSGVVIFTDMFGGTPTNIALSLLEEGRVEIITGVNLPMLIKFSTHRSSEKTLGSLTALLKEYGQASMVLAGETLKHRK